MQTLHVISHTHWDREWYQTFQQFRLKLVHLIDKLLDILESDPNYKHFMLDGQTIVLDDYLHMRPENEEKLRRHVQEGRIQIGPWHILPDMFLVSPEAHVRNLLQGRRTAERFGPIMPIGYMPDSFGHIGQMPQILKGFGIETAALWRGLSDQPAELWWESPDGSKVLLAYLRDSYSNGANLPIRDPELFIEQIAIATNSLSAHSAVHDHLIMFGTDHMEPSPRTSASIECANSNLPDTRVLHSTLPGYIESIKAQIEQSEKSIPTVSGELRACDRSPLLPGVLSSRMWIKQRNHASQTLLEKWAEPFSVFAEHLLTTDAKLASPDDTASNRIRNVAPILRQAWRLLMENHPHDSICGCSIDQVHDEMKPRFDQVDQVAEEITHQVLQALSGAVDTQLTGVFSALVLFNPFGHTHHDLVEVGLKIPEGIAAYELISADMTVIPHEFIGSNNDELANVLLRKSDLRDTIGAITDGRVAGAAIVSVKVIKQGSTVRIDAILDDKGHPNIPEWQQAEKDIAAFESDPGVTHFQVLARTPQASKIRFISPDIPALGWRTVWVRLIPAQTSAPAKTVNPLLKPFLPLVLRFAQSEPGVKLFTALKRSDEIKPPFAIENEFFGVDTAHDGTLTVIDKRTQTIFSGLNRFVDGGDAGDEYNYSPPQGDALSEPRQVTVKVFRHQLVPTLEIEYKLAVPVQLSTDRKTRSNQRVSIPITSRISLVPGVARIDVQTEVDNRARDHRLRVHFPAPFVVDAADYDGHYTVVRRPTRIQEKGEKWVESPRPETHQAAFTSVSKDKVGLTIANRGLPEVEVLENDGHTEIAVTLLRSVGWLSRDDLPVRQGHAGPGLKTPGGQVPGLWTYDYSIIPNTGDWQESFLQAAAFQTFLRALETGIHPGEIPPQGSFISPSPAEFVVSAIKAAEQGKGWLVRGYNISSEKIQVHLKPLRRFAHARLVNLAEEEISSLEIDDDGSVVMPAGGHEIVSVIFSD